MSFDEFLVLADRLDSLIRDTNTFFFSTFEPLLNRNILKMMDHLLAINPAMQFPMVTNTMIINDRLIDRLLEYPVPSYTISLDGVRKSTVEQFKTGASFDKIIGAIEKLVKLDTDSSVGTVFLLHKNNIDELSDYPDFVNNLGVKTIYINHLFVFSDEFSSWHLYGPEAHDEVEETFDYIVERAKENGQQIWLPSVRPKEVGCRQCEYLFIDIDGSVSPCDFLSVGGQFNFLGNVRRKKPVIFGNVYQDEPLDIYQSTAFKDFRRRHREGKELPESCRYCIDAYGLLCSNREVHGVEG